MSPTPPTPPTPPADQHADATPPAGTTPPAKAPLRRSTHDRFLLGLLGGAAPTLGIDATLLRVLVLIASVIVLPLTIVTYLVAAAIVPRDDGAAILGEGPADSRDTTVAVVGVLLGAPLVFGAGDDIFGTFLDWPVVVLAAGATLGVLIVRLLRGDAAPPPASFGSATNAADATPTPDGDTTPPSASATSPTTQTAAFHAQSADDTAVFVQPGSVAATTASSAPSLGTPPQKRRSWAGPAFAALMLAPVVFVLVVVAGGADGGLSQWAVVLAVMAFIAAVSAVAIAITRPSFLGPGLLVLLAAFLGTLSIGMHVAAPMVKDGVGERTIHITSVQELKNTPLRLGMGDLTIDARDLQLQPGSRTRMTASIGFGEIRVIVPRGVRVVPASGSTLTQLNAAHGRRADQPTGRDIPVIELDASATGAEVFIQRAGRNGELVDVANETVGFWSQPLRN